MKKINLIKRLFMDSHEKQSPQRFGRYAAILIMLLTLGVGQMWANEYFYSGQGNGTNWTKTAMTVSDDKFYEYYNITSTTTHQFKIGTSSDQYAYNYTYVQSGFNSTNVTQIGDYGSNNCYCWKGSTHYILVYYPNTAINTSGNPKICASTTLPNNASVGFETSDASNKNNGIIYYKGSSDIREFVDRDNGSTIDAGTVSTLYLKGYFVKMYQNTDLIYGGDAQYMSYKIHRTAVSAGTTGYTDVQLGSSNWTWGDWSSYWRHPYGEKSLNVNLLSGLGSGKYTMTFYYEQRAGSNTYRLPSSSSKYNKLTWTIDVPAVSGGNVTSDGTGTGASGTPFSVADGEEITFTAGGSQASTDANSVLYVKWGDDSYAPASSTTKTITPTTTKQSMTVKLKYYNSADELSGAETTLTIYYQSTLTPSIGISSISPSPANSGDEVTITASRQNAGEANITYQYSTNGSTWTTIGSATSSTSKTWTVPASTSTTTYYFRAQMTYEATTYTSATTTLKAYGKKTIKVKNTNGWASMLMHRWGGDKTGTSWPGESAQISAYGSGQWKQIVLYSSNTSFALVDGSNNDNHTADLTYASSVSDGSCYQIQSGTGGSLTLTSASCPEKPSVTTAAATSVATTSVTFNASGVDANNDAITEYGFKWGTTDACSSGTVTASNLGGGTSFSASKSSLTNGTTYYFKAYATNGQGTTYGSAVSVRTMFVTTVTLNPQGGSGGTTSVDATEGSAMPSGKTAPGKTGYTFGGYYASAGGSGTQYYNSSMGSANNWDVAASTATIHAKWTPITYTIHFNGNGNTSGSMSNQTSITYDASTNITTNAFVKTGYNFAGWATTQERANAGTVDRTDGASHGNLASTQGATAQLWAVWTPKSCDVVFDFDEEDTGHGSHASATTGTSATYGVAMTSVTPPTAAEGYAFMGYYTAADGAGTQYYDGDGNSAANWAVDTESETTLYAYYKQAEIASVTFDDDVVEPGATVTATANIDPDPAGTTTVCWRLLHDNGNEYSPQPTFEPASGATVSFRAPETSTHYKVEAKLHTGSSCGGGTLLDTERGRFQVAGSHTVTVNYKCGDDVIKAATSVTATPLDWTEEFTAPDIFGYTFARWDAADGVTIKNGDSDPVTTTTEATIQIKATYNGKLTAVYTQKSMIFFKNTLGWEDVYVNFYTGSYWNNPKGSGNQSVTNRNKHMSRYGETDIWYYDYGAASITPGLYVSFTSDSQDNTQYFWKSGGVNVVYPANYPDDINTDKSSENGFKAATPMFVPLATQDGVTLNQSSGGKADYFNAGYWTKYTPGTGYRLEIYNSAGNSFIKAQDFTSADDLMPMKATVDLEGGTTYKFQLKRSGDIYYGNSGTMTYANHGSPTPWDMTNGSFSMCGITTNAAGDYTFNLSYSGNSSTPPHYRLRMAVDYPVADGDYRLIYKDAVHTNWHPSAIVSKGNDRKDTVSFFVRPDSSPEMKIQTASVNPSTGAVTWGSDVAIPTATLTGLASTDVYNFNLAMDGSGNISLESVDTYTGNFYIRTDAANSKWDNYRSDPDHLMVYSEYSIEHGGYTHYHAHWVNKDDAGRKNVKFTIANDYSPCISDTLTRETAEGTWANIDDFMTTGGDLKRSANVRFMWDKRDNSISRAYVDGAQGDYSTNFLYMLNVEAGADKIRKSDESALTDHKVTFKDNGNWMYEANIQAQPTAQIKLLSNWGESPTITQYFRGASDATETLIGGSGSNWYDIRLIYDFKTNRLIAGLIPSGTIDEQMAIHADVMFIREHHGDIAQLTFAEKDSKMGAITDIETAFGVLQFNKWTLNNKSKADGHAPLSPLLSAYERDLFYVSFPFKVAMEDVFGFGTYGQHWIIEYYDGASRAANGYWQESGPNWKFITNRKGKYFEPGIGYIIALDLDELGESSSVWANTDQVELYFPSYGTMDNITSSTATYDIPEHLCTIDRSNEPKPGGGTLGDAYDRRVKDSHWNVLGVPTYVNPEAPEFANTDWITTATETSVGPNFLYEWNMDDNSVSAVSASGYTYHAMHAYLVQYCGDVTWSSSVSVKPSSIVARRTYEEAPKSVEFRLELTQNDVAIDQTFVKLSDNEAVTTGFEFNYDLSKEFNKNKSNIYTLIGTEQVAGNVLPLTEQTTVVPVGVKIATNGDYTFSMPDGTEGIGVTLIDNETGIRTSLSALDYTVFLEAGTYDGRFIIEISPLVGVWTDVKQAVSDQSSDVRKVIIDQQMYIIKDGKMFDARGAVVK